MNSKERVLAALNHQTTDRVPIALAHGYWKPDVEQALREHFYLKGYDTLNCVFNIDAYWVEPTYCGEPLGTDDDGNPLGIWGTSEDTSLSYTDEAIRPLSEASSVADVEAYPWPRIEWFDFSSVKVLADLYRDYAIVGPWTWNPTFCRIAELCGFESALMSLVSQPKLMDAMIEKITDWNCAMWQNVLDAAPGQIDIAFVGDDFASQTGMMMSPDQFRRYFKPGLARLFDVAKSRGVRVMFHICGNPRDIIPDLIEIGMDILMPLQLREAGMDPEKLKREFGADISFWGGVDTQHLLPYGRPEEVRTEVRRLIDILGRDGGYVLSSSHNLLGDVLVANIVAMYDEAARYYPF